MAACWASGSSTASATSPSSTAPACGLLLEKVADPADLVPRGCIYFRCSDIALAVAELEKRGLAFTGKPHLIARMDDHDLWMAFFKDPDGQAGADELEHDDVKPIRRPDRSEGEWRDLASTTGRKPQKEGRSAAPRSARLRSGRRRFGQTSSHSTFFSSSCRK